MTASRASECIMESCTDKAVIKGMCAACRSWVYRMRKLGTARLTHYLYRVERTKSRVEVGWQK